MKLKFVMFLAVAGLAIAGCSASKNTDGSADTLVTDTVDTTVIDTTKTIPPDTTNQM